MVLTNVDTTCGNSLSKDNYFVSKQTTPYYNSENFKISYKLSEIILSSSDTFADTGKFQPQTSSSLTKQTSKSSHVRAHLPYDESGLRFA